MAEDSSDDGVIVAQSPDSDRLVAIQPRNNFFALGLAVNMLRGKEPFSGYNFGRLSSVLAGEVLRKHFLFAARAGKPVGYAGWARCSETVAKGWIENNRIPSYEECRAGDWAILLTFFAETRDVTFFLTRECRKRNPNAKIAAVRDYGERRRLVRLDRSAGTER